jgi:hypothetical protein
MPIKFLSRGITLVDMVSAKLILKKKMTNIRDTVLGSPRYVHTWPLPDDMIIGKGEWVPARAAHIETDPSGKDLNSPGAKADAGKIRPWLMFSGFAHALEEVAKVTSLGAAKYTPNGWVDVPDAENRYMDAFVRHMIKLGQGQKYDIDPGGIGTHHLAQMIWNLLAVLELELRANESSGK